MLLTARCGPEQKANWAGLEARVVEDWPGVHRSGVAVGCCIKEAVKASSMSHGGSSFSLLGAS